MTSDTEPRAVRDGAIQDLEEEATGSMPLELRLPTSPATRRWWGGTASTSRRREVAAWRGAGGDGCVCVCERLCVNL